MKAAKTLIFVVGIFTLLPERKLRNAIWNAFAEFFEPCGGHALLKLLRLGSHRAKRTDHERHRWNLTIELILSEEVSEQDILDILSTISLLNVESCKRFVLPLRKGPTKAERDMMAGREFVDGKGWPYEVEPDPQVVKKVRRQAQNREAQRQFRYKELQANKRSKSRP